MKVVIPTRNRPTSLEGVLAWFARFYPTADVLIADGSDQPFQDRNREVVAESAFAVELRSYPPEMSLFDRLLDVLRGLDSDFVLMAADDDYPIMETLDKAQRQLVKHPDAGFAGGHLVHLKIDDKGTTARLDPVRNLMNPDPGRRMRMFASYPFTTTYGVARRELLIARYEFLRTWSVPKFFDFGVGLLDLTYGQYIGLPQLGFVCTRNETHSYFRSEDPLVYLRMADQVLELHDHLVGRLRMTNGADPQETEALVSNLIRGRVAAVSGAPPHRLRGFTSTYPYATAAMTDARRQFADLFREGTETRHLYAERLAFIADRLQRTMASTDNAGEAARYGSL